jgi:glycosyltransferase involved in cell wall biosynthesis
MNSSTPDEHERRLRVAMIGKGWFPDELGGLDRYFANLFSALSELPAASPRAVVMGHAAAAPAGVTVMSRHDAPLLERLVAGVRAARSLDVDVVDAHFALYALVPLWLTPLRKVPLLVHFHGPWADEGESGGVRGALKRRLERAVYRRATVCVTLTHAFKRVLVERYGVAPWKIVVEPPGVDREHFSPGDRTATRVKLGIADTAFVACCVRRLVPRMGIEHLIEAWGSVTGRLDGAVLLIAGEGALRQELEDKAMASGLADSVRFLGRISDADLVELYRAADVNVVPTVAHEGFGLVILEAAACGVPSVVTNVGGLPEAVRDLDPTLVVDSASAKALADRLAAQLPSAEDTLAFSGRYSWPEVAQRNLDLLHTVTGTRTTQRKMRVVYLDHVAQLSGGELALLRLLPHLTEVEAHVILAEDGPFADSLAAVGISVEVVPMFEGARGTRKENVRAGRLPLGAILGSIFYTFRIARRLRQLKPDLVHTNSLKAGFYGGIAAKLAGVPVIWHARDRMAADYLPDPAVRLARVFIKRFASAVLANSQATLATLGQPSRATVVYSVVPEVIHTWGAWEARESRRSLTFGIVGRLAPWKGQHVFLEAFARAFPNGDQRAVVIGSAMFGADEQRYAVALTEQARALGISERVEFRGFRRDVPRELKTIEVLVHASTTPEPFGQVIVEGMAAGLAVVATAAGGPLELINDGVDGLLYPLGDVDGLADILARLDTDPSLGERLGRAARKRAENFRPGPVAERVQALYAQTLRDAKNG